MYFFSVVSEQRIATKYGRMHKIFPSYFGEMGGSTNSAAKSSAAVALREQFSESKNKLIVSTLALEAWVQ